MPPSIGIAGSSSDGSSGPWPTTDKDTNNKAQMDKDDKMVRM
jgi:hypothetical protein